MPCSVNHIKTELIETAGRLYDKGFTPGCSGNISCRVQNEILITASGCCLGELTEKDVLRIDTEGNLLETSGKASSERFMHTEIYKKRADVSCIIHAHPPKSTALSVAGIELKAPLIAESIVILGEIPIIEYETPSTFELASRVADGFINYDAVLMANHGVAVCGKDIKKTFYKLETIEFSAEVCLITELLGKKNPIPHEKLEALAEIRKKMEY